MIKSCFVFYCDAHSEDLTHREWLDFNYGFMAFIMKHDSIINKILFKRFGYDDDHCRWFLRGISAADVAVDIYYYPPHENDLMSDMALPLEFVKRKEAF